MAEDAGPYIYSCNASHAGTIHVLLTEKVWSWSNGEVALDHPHPQRQSSLLYKMPNLCFWNSTPAILQSLSEEWNEALSVAVKGGISYTAAEFFLNPLTLTKARLESYTRSKPTLTDNDCDTAFVLDRYSWTEERKIDFVSCIFLLITASYSYLR